MHRSSRYQITFTRQPSANVSLIQCIWVSGMGGCHRIIWYILAKPYYPTELRRGENAGGTDFCRVFGVSKRQPVWIVWFVLAKPYYPHGFRRHRGETREGAHPHRVPRTSRGFQAHWRDIQLDNMVWPGKSTLSSLIVRPHPDIRAISSNNPAG